MQTLNYSKKSKLVNNVPKASAAPHYGELYLTPEKKTKACNYSPGKKPIRKDSGAAGADIVSIKPFNLLS